MEDYSILKLFFFGVQAPLWIKAFAFLLQVTYRWDLAAAGSIIKGGFCTFVYCILVCVCWDYFGTFKTEVRTKRGHQVKS